MKNRLYPWGLGLILSALPIAAGCAPSPNVATNEPAPIIAAGGTTNAIDAAEEEQLASAEMEEEVVPAVDPAEAPIKPVTTAVVAPADLQLAQPVQELVKLVNSGVDESVMLALATNSASTFNLNADQIIYLKDIGVPATVITAMIQRDQALKEAGPVVAAASSPQPVTEPAATNQTASAPPGPPPGEVAPQPDGTAPNSVATAPSSTVTYDTFYDSLSPYGTWLEVEGYGRVWQPSVVVVNSGWQPYYDNGRWVYTDSGWYWYSYYSWGWAPFHYGRWFRHHSVGWCWSPGYVWSPAWVTWRYNDAYCGWAPLPPGAYYRPGFGFTYYGQSVAVNFSFGLSSSCYAFVPVHHFHSHHPYRHRLPPHHHHKVYNETVAVNRPVHRNNAFVNQGLPASHITKQTGTQVPRVPVQQVSTRPGGSRPERLTAGGNQLVTYRPDLKSTQSGSPLNQRPTNPFLATPKNTPAKPAATLAPTAGGQNVPVATTRSPAGGNRLNQRNFAGSRSAQAPEQPAPTVGKPAVDAVPQATGQAAVKTTTPTRTPTAPVAGNPFVNNGNSAAGGNRLNARPQTKSASTPPPVVTAPTPQAPKVSQNPATPAPQTTPSAPANPFAPVNRMAPQTAAPSVSRSPSVQNAPQMPRAGSPLIMRGNSIVSTPAPTAPAPQVAPTTPASPPPATTASRPTPGSGSALAQRPTFSQPSVPQNRFVAPQVTAPQSTPSVPRSMPSPSVSAPSFQRPQPSYAPPATTYSRPAPTYSAPAPRPAPSYTPAPRPSAPSYSPPARSYSPPARSYSPPPSSSFQRPPAAMPAPSQASRSMGAGNPMMNRNSFSR